MLKGLVCVQGSTVLERARLGSRTRVLVMSPSSWVAFGKSPTCMSFSFLTCKITHRVFQKIEDKMESTWRRIGLQ